MRKRYLEITKSLAHQSPNPDFRFGSILIRGNNIINKSTNQNKTHPLKALMYPERDYKGLHAEVSLLRGYRRYDVEGADIYIVRLMAEFPGLAKPCDVCESFLKTMGIKRVFYSIYKDEFGCLKL